MPTIHSYEFEIEESCPSHEDEDRRLFQTNQSKSLQLVNESELKKNTFT